MHLPTILASSPPVHYLSSRVCKRKTHPSASKPGCAIGFRGGDEDDQVLAVRDEVTATECLDLLLVDARVLTGKQVSPYSLAAQPR
jgi:hypothetical protein